MICKILEQASNGRLNVQCCRRRNCVYKDETKGTNLEGETMRISCDLPIEKIIFPWRGSHGRLFKDSSPRISEDSWLSEIVRVSESHESGTVHAAAGTRVRVMQVTCRPGGRVTGLTRCLSSRGSPHARAAGDSWPSAYQVVCKLWGRDIMTAAASCLAWDSKSANWCWEIKCTILWNMCYYWYIRSGCEICEICETFRKNIFFK